MMPQAELERAPQFQATVEMLESGDVVAAYLRTPDGRQICIGRPKSSAEMVGFIQSLHLTNTYTLPDAFVSFQKSQAGKK